MGLNISTSVFGLQNKSSKDLIVSVLSEEWPLSVKEIYVRVGKRFESSVSYQAVHKSIIELEQENILVKNGKNYELSREWISSVKKFGEQLENKYSDSVGKYDIDPNFEGTIKLKFDDVSVFGVTMAKIFASTVLVGNGPKWGIGTIRHLWWPLKFSFLDFDLFKKMANVTKGSYVIVQENTPFDKYLKNQYIKGGIDNVVLGFTFFDDTGDDLVIHGDTIMQVKFSPETKALIDELYEKTHNLADLFKHYAKQISVKQKNDIEVTITKNPQLASLLRNQMIQYFKEAK